MLSPRARRPVLLAILLLLLLPVCAGRREGPRNVLLITVDTLRADRLGCYGGIAARTPSIDRIAREGTLFTRAFSSIPITLSSHASILTGLYPRTHKVLSHGYRLDAAYETLAETLGLRGYKTAAFVSSHVLDDGYGLAQGFDIYWERFNYGKKRAEEIEETTGTDLLTAAWLDWMRLEMKEPFFLWLHWFQPHKPYEPAWRMRDLYDTDPASPLRADVPTLQSVWHGTTELAEKDVDRFRNLYAGEVAFTDRQVGIVLAKLQELGVLDNTLVVFTADHGEVLYEHDRYFGHDIMLYEESIHVPLILRGPGIIREGRTHDLMTSNVDLLPTILDLVGVPPGERALDGRSLAPALRGGEEADRPVFAEVFPPKEVWKSAPLHAVREGEWKLIARDGSETPELFDLANDPRESENLAADSVARREEMEGTLRRWMGASEELPAAYPELTEEERRNLKSLGYIEE
jgi:arylsulfatase A-like enzyme